jgi:secondary thiamine-phosphate synthase enzyme
MFIKIDVQTRSKVDLVDITSRVVDALAESEVKEGVCFIYCPHTTAGIVLNENWDPSVEKDIAMVLEHIVPDDLSYSHREGNSPAHIKSVLVSTDHFVLVHQGELQLGQWQGVFLADFDGPRHRTIWLNVWDDCPSG